MIVRHLVRRVIGALIRMGRTLRGRERHSAPKMGTGLSVLALGPHKPTQEVES